MRRAAIFLASAFALASALTRADVDTKTGVFGTAFVDVILDGPVAWKLTRAYSSSSPYRGVFGNGWSAGLDTFLSVAEDGSLVVHESGGKSTNVFVPAAGGAFRSTRFRDQTITREKWGYCRLYGTKWREYYDAQGRLFQLQDEKGVPTHLVRDAAGRVVAVETSKHERAAFTYNARGLVTRIDLAGKKPAAFEYNERDELIRSRDLDGNEYSFAYSEDGKHKLRKIVSGKRTQEIGYYGPDGGGLVQTYKDYDGATVEYKYKVNGVELGSAKVALGAKIAAMKDMQSFDVESVKHATAGTSVSNNSYEFKKATDGSRWLYRHVQTTDGKKAREELFDENGAAVEEERDTNPLTASEESALKRYYRSVVRIRIEGKYGWTEGTGFFITPDGVIATNKHVLEDALRYPDYKIKLTLPTEHALEKGWSGETKATLRLTLERGARVFNSIRMISCGKTWGRDVCLFKVDHYPKAYFRPVNTFPAEGVRVFTIGNPLGHGLMIDEGTFLSRRNHNGVSEVSYSMVTRHGNSGGPVFTEDGALLGIHYFKRWSNVGTQVVSSEQDGISSFEILAMLEKYANDPRTYSIDEFRQQISPTLEWMSPDKSKPVAKQH